MTATFTAALVLMAVGLPAAPTPAALPAGSSITTAALDLPLCSQAPPAVDRAAHGTFDPGVSEQSYCKATCGSSYVDCNGSSCYAVDQNCAASVRGYVECDGNRTDCPACCSEGAFDIWYIGGCCGCNGGEWWGRKDCVNGVWEYGQFCGFGTCPVCP